MINEAKAHEEEDQRKRVEIETRNQADSLVYSVEKTLEDNKDNVPQDLKEEVEGKIAVLKSAIAANDVAAMQPAMADLNDAMQRLGQAVYSQTGGPAGSADAGPAGGSAPGGDQPGDDTVEGEFREV